MDLADRIRRAGKVLLIGNGGSYANAIHVCNDLVGCGIAAFVPDIASFSAAANDFGYYYSFKRWVTACGRSGDMLIALSGSGKSPNILLACDEAKLIGMDVYTIFGKELGQDMQQAEEFQLKFGHDLMRALRK